MSSLATAPAVSAPLGLGLPRPKRWSVAEFHALRGLSAFESRRMILVNGDILDMPNPNPPHDVGIGETEDALRVAFGSGFWVRVQMALVFGQSTDPVPDLAVVPGPKRGYTSHPTNAVLVVEVADSSLSYDTGEKADLYAAGLIQDYWVVDLNHRQLHVFRDPAADSTRPMGTSFRTRLTLTSSESVTPFALPNAAISVSDLLP